MRIFLIVLVALLANPCHSENKKVPFVLSAGSDAILFNVHNILIKIDNTSQDDCITKSDISSYKIRAETEARRDNFGITSSDPEKSLLADEFYISIVSYQLGGYPGSCAVKFDAYIKKWIAASTPYASKLPEQYQAVMISYIVPIYGTLTTGPRDKINNMIKSDIDDSIDKLYIITGKARDNIKAEWPEYLEMQKTLEEKQ